MECRSVQETNAAAALFVANLKPAKERATIVELRGELGSGKTTFVKAVAEALGVKDTVTSPTFVIEKVYKVSHPHFTNLVHIDAYRLESGNELRALGFPTLTQDPHNLILIEWPERVADILPENTPTLSFTFVDEYTRDIILPHAQESTT
ncbi:tRNA (adenosine(37)-N6)-threonylcarbamoyltransferase complex ATPase subunit type 1 TsaE [Candidatus Wolfebacteria bacterium]|nr:tRNA (adenosine(37)-N6)-threonylcarbamoyltransferase complex ATPase subunit type 1 TsaE [Candidatus Wolfebacteria bacterium]